MLGASLLAALPIVADAAVLPPVGLLLLLGWRLLRPELWPAWVALPLGLFDDLVAGQAPGSAMACWTLCLLAVDRIDQRVPQRDHWLDWSIAAIAIIFVALGALLAAGLPFRTVPTILPQIAISILIFPAVVRMVAALDRWRLRR